MPWKKNFEVDDAIADAMRVFWAKGYENTSIADLTEATGVKRQSLYNAIGDKRALFVKALLRYDADYRRAALSGLEARGEPRAAIQDLFFGAAKEAADDQEQKGCFLVNTSLEMSLHDPVVRTLVSSSLEDFRRFFERMIEHAQVRSEISKTIDPEATASGLLGMFVGIRVLARGAVSKEILRHQAEQAVRLLGPTDFEATN